MYRAVAFILSPRPEKETNNYLNFQMKTKRNEIKEFVGLQCRQSYWSYRFEP